MSARQLGIILAVLLIGAAAYSNTFTAPFQFDDDAYIINNPALRTSYFFLHPFDVARLSRESPTSFPPALQSAFPTRLIGYLSFALNYQLHGLDVAGYHAVNLAVHLVNGILFYLLSLALLRTGLFSGLFTSRSRWSAEAVAALPALLFISHPIQTQAVTYISQRFASLASLFCLLSLLLYVRFRSAPAGRMRRIQYAAALVSAVAAMLTKEFSFTLPVLIALCEITFFKGSRGERMKLLVPFALTLAIIPALVFSQQGSLDTLESTMRTITAADATNIPRLQYALTQTKAVMLYLRLLVFPAGQNVDHDLPVSTSLFEPAVLLSSLVLIVLLGFGSALLLISRKRGEHPELRVAGFGILWFFITLSVESSVIPLGELVAEYRLYLPSVGIFAAAIALVAYVVRRYAAFRLLGPKFSIALFACLVIVLSIATYQRNTVWGSEISLWEDAAQKSPLKSRPRQNLGTYYMLSGRLEEAGRELTAALGLDPNNFELHNNLGIVYKRRGDYEGAVREFTAASRLMPGDGIAHYNLGNVYMAQGNIQEALRAYRTSISLMPDYDEAHNNLGIAYERIGLRNEAIAAFQQAVRLNPNNVNARNNLAHQLRKGPVR